MRRSSIPLDRAVFEDARNLHDLSDVIGRHIKLVRAGREMKGQCPFHPDRSPSFFVNDARGVAHCFGCGWSGDAIDFVAQHEGVSKLEATRILGAAELPIVDPAKRAKAIEEDAADRAAAIADAREMWASCVSIEGTPGEVYLRRARGITMELPPVVRFGMVPTSRDDGGDWKRPFPAVVLSCTNVKGELVGLQRIFISDDGAGKRWRKAKLSLGRPKGAAVQLAPASEELIVCEGPEDGLSLQQANPERAVWVALGTAMLAAIELPRRTVKRVIIAGQNDAAGRAAVQVAGESLVRRGFAVSTAFPEDGFKDWNDRLRDARR